MKLQDIFNAMFAAGRHWNTRHDFWLIFEETTILKGDAKPCLAPTKLSIKPPINQSVRQSTRIC